MHLPATSEFIFDSFNHQTLAGLNGRASLGTCPCELPVLPFRGIGQVDPASAGISAGTQLAAVALSSWLADKKQNAMLKTYTTSVVNDLEPLLRQNVAAYLAGPGSCADQQVALSAFDSAWQWLQSSQACGNIQLGTPGQNCINDRAPGGKWDWTAYYRTPIANDPRAASCTTQGTDAAEQASVTNIFNKISGSNVQTAPTTFDSNALSNASTSTGASNPLTGSMSTDLASLAQSLTSGTTQIGSVSVPTLGLLAAGALILVMAMSGGHR